MKSKSFTYPIPWGGQLIITPEVVMHLWKHRQRCLMHERGGQLFGTFQSRGVTIIEHASGPIKSARTGPTRYVPDREFERQEIHEMFDRGLHYLGDWHTHPESVPTPSYRDQHTLKSCYAESRKQRKALIMIIVGRDRFPDGLSVSLINDNCVTLSIT